MQFLRWFVTFLVALACAVVGIFLMLPLGLVVQDAVVLPLATVVGALLAALGAGWAGTRLARDGTRTRLLPLVGATEGAAVLLALILVGLQAVEEAQPARFLPPPGVIGLVVGLLLALCASLAAWRLRTPAGAASGDVQLTLLLLGLVIVGVPGVIAIAAFFGLVGA